MFYILYEWCEATIVIVIVIFIIIIVIATTLGQNARTRSESLLISQLSKCMTHVIEWH